MSIPNSFERYLETRNPGPHHPDRTHCMGCLRPGEPISSDGYCEPCLREQYGFDLAEEKMLDALIGGAVKGALDLDLFGPEVIVAAVMRAIQDFEEKERVAAWHAGRRAVG